MPGFDTVGADEHFFYFAVIERSNPLKVRVKATFRNIMGVTHVAPDHGFFSAYFTHFRHDLILPEWKSLSMNGFAHHRKPQIPFESVTASRSENYPANLKEFFYTRIQGM